MSETELYQLLKEIPEKDFNNPLDFERQIISNFVKILDYNDENLFFHQVYSESGHIQFEIDAIVGKNRIKRPWLILEAKYRTKTPENDPEFVRNLFSKIFEIGDPEFFVILSNWKIWYGSSVSQIKDYELEKIGETDAAEIYSDLKPPESLPDENFFDLEIESEESSIETSHFELDLMEFHTKLENMKDASTTQEKKRNSRRIS